jgi:spore germination protein GerM
MMKAIFNLVACFGIFVVLLEASVFAVPQAKVAARKEVKVYFYHDPGEYIDLAPVTRLVNATAPARPAIEALLKGPTAAERQKGFESLASASDFRIDSLKISNGTARINFISTRRWAGWPGDLAPVRFKTAVELTLKQFHSVQRVIVSLNGDTKFYDERETKLVYPENPDILSKPFVDDLLSASFDGVADVKCFFGSIYNFGPLITRLETDYR